MQVAILVLSSSVTLLLFVSITQVLKELEEAALETAGYQKRVRELEAEVAAGKGRGGEVRGGCVGEWWGWHGTTMT